MLLQHKFKACVVFILCAMLAAVVHPAFEGDGKPTYCYVEYDPSGQMPAYMLKAYRPWRPNILVGVFPTPAEAAQTAEMVGCSFQEVSSRPGLAGGRR